VSRFAADWLRRRDPFDAAARNRELGRRFGAALANERGGPRRIIDLAAGLGANFMALAPLIGDDQEWLLIDNDSSLLAAQAEEIARWSEREGWRCRNIDKGVLVETATDNWRVSAQRLDLAQSLEQIDFAACDGITTSAFLDLVSAAWLDRLCGLLTRYARPLLAMLTVDGRRVWHPSQLGDVSIHDSFLRHQTGDKGFGPALGCLAVNYLAGSLTARGYAVSTVCSDWRITAEHREMLLQMVEESAAVARETQSAASTLFTEWSEERYAQIRAGLLTLNVGHLDLLAVPAEGSSASSGR
jgi:hypothetical protein